MNPLPRIKKVKDNFRIELQIPYDMQRILKTERDFEHISDDLNSLLKDHYTWKGYESCVNYDEEDCCILCNHKYEPMIEDGKEYCANCGAGDKEYMLNKLEKSK